MYRIAKTLNHNSFIGVDLSRLELVAQFLETFHKGECLVYMIFLYHFACFIG